MSWTNQTKNTAASTNQTKNTGTSTNQTKHTINTRWNEETKTWEEMTETWEDLQWKNQTKNSNA